MEKHSRRALALREQKLIEAKVPHGVPGQLNICVLDTDSDVTDYGRHNRLIVMGDLGPGDKVVSVTIREDLRGLPLSTEEDRMRVAMGWQRQHPQRTRLVFKGKEEEEHCIHWKYEIVR